MSDYKAVFVKPVVFDPPSDGDREQWQLTVIHPKGARIEFFDTFVSAVDAALIYTKELERHAE